jgi:hypothetical protein
MVVLTVNKDLLQSALDGIKATEGFKTKAAASMHSALNGDKKVQHGNTLWFKKVLPIAAGLIIVAGIATFAVFHFNQQKVSSTDSTIRMQEVNGNLYFQIDYNTGLCVYDKKQGQISVLHTKTVYSMTSFEDNLFYTTMDYELYQYDTDTGKQNKIYSFDHDKNSYIPRVFYADNQYAYAEKDGHIYRISLSDGKASVITTIDDGYISNLKVIQNVIYYCLASNDNGGVYRMSLSGGTIEKLCSFVWVRDIFQYKDKLIFTADKSITITNVYSMDMDGGNVTQISSSPIVTSALSVSNHSVYFQTADGVREYDLDTGSQSIPSISTVTELYGVDNGLYCYNPAHSGHIWFYDFSTKESTDIQGKYFKPDYPNQ